MKYLVTVEETLKRSYIVEAADEESAYDIIDEAVNNQEFDLDWSDFFGREIEVKEAAISEIGYYKEFASQRTEE